MSETESAPAMEADGFDPWKRLVDATPDVVLIVDRELQVIFTNDACDRVAPFPLAGRSLLDAIKEDQYDRVRERVHRCFETRVAFAVEGDHAENAEWTWYQARYVPISRDGLVEFVGVVASDMTDRWRAEKALQKSEERYRQLIDNSLDIVAMFDSDGLLNFVSPNVEGYLGFSPESLVGTPLFELIHPDDLADVERTVRFLFRHPGRHRSLEAAVRGKDGKYRTIEARTRVMESADGLPQGVVNARDISERKETEALRQKLFRADKLAAIGQLAAGVAHEINNPASYVTTNLYLLREYARDFQSMYEDLQGLFQSLPAEPRRQASDYLKSKEVERLLGEMSRMTQTSLSGMERISQIVQDLRTFSRDELDTVEMIDLNSVVEASCNIVRNQISYFADLVIELEELPRIAADRGKLQQVLINLLVNAVHAVSEADDEDGHRIVVRTRREQDSVVLEVEDTGCGIEPHVEERMFEPFFTTKPMEQGTGLGLWMCLEIVRKNHGELRCETAPGVGTTFTVEIPIQDDRDSQVSEPPLATAPSAEPQELPSRRILIVDDDELVLSSYRKLLEGRHEVVTAAGGKRALSVLKEDRAFDVILCDIMMPSVDGRAIYEHLQQSAPELLEKTVFCTAGVFTRRAREFVEGLHDQVIYKPISPRQLRDIICRVAP